jgi:hypothetical protein
MQGNVQNAQKIQNLIDFAQKNPNIFDEVEFDQGLKTYPNVEHRLHTLFLVLICSSDAEKATLAEQFLRILQSDNGQNGSNNNELPTVEDLKDGVFIK